jgi:hypothetical protein
MSDDLDDLLKEPGATPSRLRVLLEFDRWLRDLGFKEFTEESGGISELRRILKGREIDE